MHHSLPIYTSSLYIKAIRRAITYRRTYIPHLFFFSLFLLHIIFHFRKHTWVSSIGCSEWYWMLKSLPRTGSLAFFYFSSFLNDCPLVPWNIIRMPLSCWTLLTQIINADNRTGCVRKMQAPVVSPHFPPLEKQVGGWGSGWQANVTWEMAGFLSVVFMGASSQPPSPSTLDQHRYQERRGKPWEVARHTLARCQDWPSIHLHLLPFYYTEIGIWQIAINATSRKTSDRCLLPLSSNLLAL